MFQRLIAAATVLLFLLTVSDASRVQTNNIKPANAKETKMYLGLRVAMYHVDDMQKAKEWYSNVLGVKPYFDDPTYVGFNVGGFDLGLNPTDAKIDKGGSTFVYWGVKDIKAEYQRLLSLGAEKHTDIQDVGGGILVATVTDPWGNIFGIIENPHFKLEANQPEN